MVFGVDAENELLVSLIENRFSRNAEFNYGRTDADFIVNGANQTRLFVVDSDQDRVIMPGFWDTDLDTGVRVEESADEDVIRFDTAGEERFRIEPDGTLLVGSAHGWDIGSAEIAHYKMNDDAPSGVVSDSLGHHGLLERDGMGEEYTTLWTQTGLVQSALDFNGTDMRIDCGNSTDFALVGDMAVSLWIRPDGWGEANTGYLIERYNVGGYRLFLQAGTNGLSFFGRTSGGASQQVASSSNAVTLGVWQHVVVTRVGTTVSFYVNGVYAGGGAIENISEDSGNANLYIANRPTWDRTFDGLIDDVRLFDRALTQSEIEGLYRFGSGTEEDSESYRLDVSGRIYASDDILTAGELVQACDPALKTAMRRPEWTADEVTSLSTRLSDAVASYRLKAHLRDEASTLSTAAPRVLGFDASKLPVECVRDVQGLLFVSPVSILALQAREIRQLREDLESLKARLEHLEGK
ncbi:LamG domain-containing protein [bacterium]|nr:LamG domain-containing protein [bacterium]